MYNKEIVRDGAEKIKNLSASNRALLDQAYTKNYRRMIKFTSRIIKGSRYEFTKDLVNGFYIKWVRIDLTDVRNIDALMFTALRRFLYTALRRNGAVHSEKEVFGQVQMIDNNNPEVIAAKNQMIQKALDKIDSLNIGSKAKIICKEVIKRGSHAEAARYLGCTKNQVKVTFHVSKIKQHLKDIDWAEELPTSSVYTSYSAMRLEDLDTQPDLLLPIRGRGSYGF
jgi:DNA-directed RNA polymerase specialized sigma24 family protein